MANEHVVTLTLATLDHLAAPVTSVTSISRVVGKFRVRFLDQLLACFSCKGCHHHMDAVIALGKLCRGEDTENIAGHTRVSIIRKTPASWTDLNYAPLVRAHFAFRFEHVSAIRQALLTVPDEEFVLYSMQRRTPKLAAVWRNVIQPLSTSG